MKIGNWTIELMGKHVRVTNRPPCEDICSWEMKHLGQCSHGRRSKNVDERAIEAAVSRAQKNR